MEESGHKVASNLIPTENNLPEGMVAPENNLPEGMAIPEEQTVSSGFGTQDQQETLQTLKEQGNPHWGKSWGFLELPRKQNCTKIE